MWKHFYILNSSRQELRVARRLGEGPMDIVAMTSRHYGRGQIFESIMRALREMRKDVSALTGRSRAR
jgi:hypothetical protein